MTFLKQLMAIGVTGMLGAHAANPAEVEPRQELVSATILLQPMVEQTAQAPHLNHKLATHRSVQL